MPRKAEPKRVKQGGKPKAVGKSKPTAKPEEADSVDSIVDVLNHLHDDPASAPFNPPGRTLWPEPHGCVRGPEESDAAFQRRVLANAESQDRMMLRNEHNARTVQERTDAELAIKSMGKPGEFLRLQQKMSGEEEDRRRAEDKRREAAVEARLRCLVNERAGITITDAARVSGINRGTIWRALDTGKIKATGTGSKRRLDAEDFIRYCIERDKRGDKPESDAEVERKFREANQA